MRSKAGKQLTHSSGILILNVDVSIVIELICDVVNAGIAALPTVNVP